MSGIGMSSEVKCVLFRFVSRFFESASAAGLFVQGRAILSGCCGNVFAGLLPIPTVGFEANRSSV